MGTTQKLWQLLAERQRRAAIVLLGMMLVGMVLETLGIGLVVPSLALMTQGNWIEKHPALLTWISSLGLGKPSQEYLIIAGMLTLMVVYGIKTVFLGFLAWRQAHFVYGLQADISQRLFTGYLHQPYVFHLQKNSAQLIRNAVGQVGDIVTVFHMGLSLIAEALVLAGIALLLFTVEPVGAALVISILGLVGWGFHYITRNHILQWGEQRQYHEGMRIQHLQQGLGGVKDVKFLGRESEFLSRYQIHNKGSASAGLRKSTLQAFPRLLFELLAVVSLVVLVLAMMAQGKSTEAYLPTLGLFAASAFRILPSVGRILNSAQNVRFSLPVITTVHTDLSMLESMPIPSKEQSISFRHMLKLERVSFSFPASNAPVLDKVSVEIGKDSSVGFIGSSGAGKSTLVDIILGLLTPTGGAVKVDGVDIQRDIRGWQNQIGYVPQTIFLTDDSLRRNVAFGIPDDQIDDDAVWRAIRAAQLEQYINQLPQGLETMVGERGIRLSGGQRQRIGIARALYYDPDVLVLDEATSSLDMATEKEVMEAVRALQGGKTILIVAHRLSTVAHCDRLYRMDRGRLFEDDSTAAALGAETN